MTVTHNDRLPLAAWLTAAIAAVIAGIAYYATLHPGVGPSFDSIELQIAVLVRGVIHPPGSPQYLLLGDLFTGLVPVGDVAFRLNLFSAACAALAVGVMALAAFRLTKHTLISGFAALVMAFGARFWYQASIAELYALNVLWIAAIVFFLVSYSETGRRGFFWAGTAAYALSFGNHTSMLLLLPAYLWIVLKTDAKFFVKPRTLLITAGIVIAAATQYLAIPLRVKAGAPLCNYCPETGASLADYLSGGPFKAWFFSLPPAEVIQRLGLSMEVAAREFQPWGLFLAAVGLWELIKEKKALGIFFLVGIACEYLFVMTYVIPDWHDFMMPVYALSALPLGWGLKAVWEAVAPRFARWPVPLREAPLALVAWAILSFSVVASMGDVDQGDQTDFITRSEALLEQVGDDAVILMPGPQSPSLYYSWAVRYTAFTDPRTFDIPLVTPPEIDPPPGPAPYYLRWADVTDQYTPEALALSATRREIYLLDWADPRAADWGLVAICVPGSGAVAGYRVTAAMVGGEVIPLVDDATWSAVSEETVFNSGEAGCWPEGNG